MQIRDVLTEAQVNSEKYIDAINQLLKQKGVNLRLEPHMKGLPDILDFYPLPGQQINSLSDTIKGRVEGILTAAPVRKIYKSDELKNLLTGKEEGTVNINKGELAEGYHATAAYARLIKRPLESVDINDVLNVISKLENGKTLVMKRPEVDNAVADEFHLTIKLKPASWDAFKDPETTKRMGGLLDSILADANHETSRYAERFATNHRFDVARIIGDGVSEESVKKTDIRFENKAEKKFADFSLKVGTTKQVHQVGGGSVEDSKRGKKATPEERFNILANNLFGVDGRFPLADIIGVKDKFLKAKTNEQRQQIAYQAAAASLNQNLQSDADEKTFIRNLIGAMKYWMGRDEPNIKVKQFTSKGTYILDPQKIDSMINNDQIDLVAKYVAGDLPKIIIGDKVSGDPLVTIRTYRNSKGYIRNYIEKEKLWVTLTLHKYIPSKQEKAKPKQVTAPVQLATAPKPALKVSQQKIGAQPQDLAAKKSVGTIGSK